MMKPLAAAVNIVGSNPRADIDSRVLCFSLLSVKYSRIVSYIVGVMRGIFLLLSDFGIFIYICFDPFILIVRLNYLTDNSVIFFECFFGWEVCDIDVGLRWIFGVGAESDWVCSTFKILHDLRSDRREPGLFLSIMMFYVLVREERECWIFYFILYLSITNAVLFWQINALDLESINVKFYFTNFICLDLFLLFSCFW